MGSPSVVASESTTECHGVCITIHEWRECRWGRAKEELGARNVEIGEGREGIQASQLHTLGSTEARIFDDEAFKVVSGGQQEAEVSVNMGAVGDFEVLQLAHCNPGGTRGEGT